MRSDPSRSWSRSIGFFTSLFVLVALLAADTARAAFSAETLKAKIEEVEASSELGSESQATLVELYRKALSYLEKAQVSDDDAEAFRRAAEMAPGQTEAARQKLERDAARPIKLGVSETAPISEIEGALAKEEANLAAVDAKLSDLEDQLTKEADRPAKIRDRLTEAKKQQEETTDKLNRPPALDETPELGEARRALLESRARALSAEIRMLDRELLSQPARVELLKAQKEEQAANVERIEARGQSLRDLLLHRRRAESEEAVAEAEAVRRETSGKHPILGQMAEENAALSATIAELSSDLEHVTADEDSARAAVKQMRERFDGLKQKLQVAGLSQTLGMVLYEEQRSLPNVKRLQKEKGERENEIAIASLRQIAHADEQGKLRNAARYADGLLAELPEEEAHRIRSDLLELIESRRALLRRAVKVDQSYVRALGELDFTQGQLIATAEAYRAYLNERLLWIRNAPAPRFEDLQAIADDTMLLISPAGWRQALDTMFTGVLRLIFLALLVALVGALVWRRRALQLALRATGQSVDRPATDQFTATLQALGLSLVLAAPWPLLAAGLGVQLVLTGDARAFTTALASALLFVSQPFFYLQVFRVVCCADGLAAAHFSWSEPIRQLLRRELRRLMISFLPPAFVVVGLLNAQQVVLTGGLLRVGLVIIGLGFGSFAYGLIQPRQGILAALARHNPDSLLTRYRYLCLALALALPAFMVLLALGGYLYTAATLTRRSAETVWFLFGLVLVHQLAVRALTLARHRLFYRAALDEAVRAEAEAKTPTKTEPGGEHPTPPAETLDLASLSEDTRKLLNAAVAMAGIMGLWLIWQSVLPALGILNETTLWYQTGIVAAEERLVPVTLADLGLALLIVIITAVAMRRFPALLEIALLQHLDMTPGGHYTATTLSRYLIVATGTVSAFSTLGFNWAQIQWLVAALSVGIGFGLQEIVANFISGLIILFERPVRVGDAVTVGDAEGIVTRIRIRATTIRTWDRKEVLVPNKEFVTGRLSNWSLSDDVTRLSVTVGVAYGSDVRKAMALLETVAEGHPRVLKDPKPTVLFESFGDNALNLTLRFFVGSLDDRLTTLSELHQEINARFNEAGIVIAFPQRDLHLASQRPLEVRVYRDEQPDG